MILTLPRILHATVTSHLFQPRVVSEIISGIILGPTVMGLIPGYTDLFFPEGSLAFLNALGQLGVILFLFMTGCHLNLERILKNKWQALFASFLGTGLTFAIAPALTGLLETPDYSQFDKVQTIILTAIILSISAEAVLARILAERQLLTSNLGSVCMATSTIDVLVCFILLAALLSLYESEHPFEPPAVVCPGTLVYYPDAASRLDALWIVLVFVGFVLAVLTVGRVAFGFMARRVAHKGRMEAVVFVASMIILFSASWLTHTLTISSLLGGLILGLFGVPRIGTFCSNIEHALGPITVGILLPVFFALVGLKTDWTLLTGKDVGVAFALFGCLLLTRFLGGIGSSLLFDGRGFKNIYFGALISCKGLTVLTIFNILLTTNSITPRFYAVAVLYALISCVFVSPFIAFVQVFDRIRKAKTRKGIAPGKETYRLLVVPRTSYLAPICATVATTLVESFASDINVQTCFLRFIDDIDNIEEFIPVIQYPISESVLAADPILGVAQMRWKGLNPRGEAIYKAVPALNLRATYHKVIRGFKQTNHEPFQYLVLGFDGENDSLALVIEAINNQNATVVIATAQPTSVLAGAQSALFCHPLDSVSEVRPCLGRFLKADSHPHTVYHWYEDNTQNRPEEVRDCSTVTQLLETVAHLKTPPSFNVIFLPLPLRPNQLIKWLKAAYNCHIPVIFEGRPSGSHTDSDFFSTADTPRVRGAHNDALPTMVTIGDSDSDNNVGSSIRDIDL